MNTVADMDTTVHLGSDTTVQHSFLRHAQVGRRCRLWGSVIEGHPEAPVIIGDDVTLINCHVQSTGQRRDFSFCNWRVSQAQTRLGQGVWFSNSRLLNTVVEDGSSGFSASIEYSHIGPRNTLRSFTNMTQTRTAEACNVGSEVSKTLILGAGFTSEHHSSYLSLVAPADYPIVTAEGREEVLTGLPNVSNIGAGSVFANYGGELLPAASIADSPGSAKGTAVVYTAFVCINCRVVNRYGQPTGQPSPFDLLRRRDLTILGFGSFVENKLTGRVPAFSYANALTPRAHSLGWVLARKPGLILNFIKKMQHVLGADAGRLQGLVQGTLRLELRLLQAELDGQQQTFYSREQLRAGLDIMRAHLQDGRWAMDKTGNWLHPWCFDTAQRQWVSSVASV